MRSGGYLSYSEGVEQGVRSILLITAVLGRKSIIPILS